MMDSIVFTNVSIFRAIADEAHERMCELTEGAVGAGVSVHQSAS